MARLTGVVRFMRAAFGPLAMLVMLIGARAPVNSAELTHIDDRGRRVVLSAPARRIVALAPNLAELAADAGAMAALVGVVRGSDYPGAVARLPQVGDAAGIDIERLMALRPDLILAWQSGNRASDIAKLEQLGMAVFVTEPRTLASVGVLLRRLGAIAHTGNIANVAAARYEARLRAMTRGANGRPRLRAMVQIWAAPIMTVSGKHLISDVLGRCGAENVFADLLVLAGSIGIEEVLLRDPDLIIAALAPGADARAAWRAWPALHAVRRGQVFEIDPDLISRSTPRILAGMEQVCAWVAAAQGRLP